MTNTQRLIAIALMLTTLAACTTKRFVRSPVGGDPVNADPALPEPDKQFDLRHADIPEIPIIPTTPTTGPVSTPPDPGYTVHGASGAENMFSVPGEHVGTARPSFGFPPAAVPTWDPLAAVDAAIADLPTAASAFSAPKQMRVGQTADVRFVVSRTQTLEVLAQKLDDIESSAPRQVGQATVKVNRKVRAVLGATPGLGIKAVHPSDERLLGSTDEGWHWAVTALSPGAQTLTLTFLITIDLSGVAEPKVIQTFEQALTVETLGRWESIRARIDWKWVIGTLVVPLVAWLWHLLKPKEGPPGKRKPRRAR